MEEIRNERVAALVFRRLVVALFLMAAIAILPSVSRAAPTQSQATDPVAAPMTAAERAAAISAAEQATVRVSSSGCGARVTGSGFVADGLVVTNGHIVGDASDVTVDQLGSSGSQVRYTVAVTSRSAGLDLAVGEVSPASTQESSREGKLSLNAAVPPIGEPVLLVGFGGGKRLSVLDATVHSVVDGAAYGSEGQVILFDRTTRVGFSGGPVVNRNGEVVAVLRAFDSVTGLSIAVPAANVVEVANRAANDAEERLCK